VVEGKRAAPRDTADFRLFSTNEGFLLTMANSVVTNRTIAYYSNLM
jgi:hypothetical protein